MGKRLVLMVLTAMVVLSGCASDNGYEANGDVTVLVTRDFGREVLQKKTVAAKKGDTVMDIMQDNFEVETAYGGGFVNSIGGLASGYTGEGNGQKHGTKTDWFYYLDGVMAEVGADQSMAEGYRTVAWDYHDWSGNTYVKTRIDSWPERFAGRNVELSASESFAGSMPVLKEAVEGYGGKADSFTLSEIDTQKEGVDTILLGSWNDVSKHDFIRRAFEKKEKSGLYATFADDGLSVFDHENILAEEHSIGALVVSIQKSYGSEDMVLLIIGNDDGLVESACEYFMDGRVRDGAFSLIITEEGVHYAP